MADRIQESQAEGVRYGRLAREAGEAADVQRQVALSRKGPAAQAVADRYATLKGRAEAIEELTTLNRTYSDLIDQGRQARQELPGIQARLEERRLGIPIVRGEARQQLLARADELERVVEETPARLIELDARRGSLENAAGPAHTREASYHEWIELSAQWPRPLEVARATDISDATRAQVGGDWSVVFRK